jgi:LacI family transcriptional regulator
LATDLAAATLRAMTEAVSRPPSDVISHPQPFDIITKDHDLY